MTLPASGARIGEPFRTFSTDRPVLTRNPRDGMGISEQQWNHEDSWEVMKFPRISRFEFVVMAAKAQPGLYRILPRAETDESEPGFNLYFFNPRLDSQVPMDDILEMRESLNKGLDEDASDDDQREALLEAWAFIERLAPWSNINPGEED